MVWVVLSVVLVNSSLAEFHESVVLESSVKLSLYRVICKTKKTQSISKQILLIKSAEVTGHPTLKYVQSINYNTLSWFFKLNVVRNLNKGAMS